MMDTFFVNMNSKKMNCPNQTERKQYHNMDQQNEEHPLQKAKKKKKKKLNETPHECGDKHISIGGMYLKV